MSGTKEHCPATASGQGQHPPYIEGGLSRLSQGADSQPIRLILDHDQTAELVRQAGGESHLGRVFAVVSPGSYPTAPGRLVMHLIECSTMQAAAAAVEVAQGLASVRRVKQSKPTASRATDAAERPAGGKEGVPPTPL